MRIVFVACVSGCLLSGCVNDRHDIAVKAASDALSCEPQNVDAYPMDGDQWDVRGCGQRLTLQCSTDEDTGYTCGTLGNTTDTLRQLGK